jgi:hypothetical protein
VYSQVGAASGWPGAKLGGVTRRLGLAFIAASFQSSADTMTAAGYLLRLLDLE